MRCHLQKLNIYKNLYITTYLLPFTFFLASCATMDPGKVTIDIAKTEPIPKVTNYTQALMDLGLMSKIYQTPILKVQSIPISDNTGAAAPTQGEIQKDITEIVKSTLNSVGGNLIYIPYDPAFVQNQHITGYSNFQNKLIPDVILSGGITEFDRGLETRDKSSEFSNELTLEGLPDYLPGLDKKVPYPTKIMEFRYERAGKTGLARITLDFNLLNFQTMSGIPRMNTVNSIEVLKGENNGEMGVSILGQAFGRKGKIKKVQGRHAAIRLLVELSMIQIIGRQLILPYWNLLGDNALPDKLVLDTVSKFFQGLNKSDRIALTQHQLILHGYNNIPINGELDKNTLLAMKDFFHADTQPDPTNLDNFIKMWSSVPINEETLKKRQYIQKIQEQQAALERELREKQAALKRKQKKQEAEAISEKAEEQKLQESVEKLLRLLEQKKREELLKLLEAKRGT